MANKEKLMDYQEFYDELIEKEYLPLKVDYNWTDKNEDFMREVLFLFYTTYIKTKDLGLVNPLLRLYSDVILAAYTHYPEEEGYSGNHAYGRREIHLFSDTCHDVSSRVHHHLAPDFPHEGSGGGADGAGHPGFVRE